MGPLALEYYDARQRYLVETEPWGLGDEPKEGVTHLVIVVGGCKFPRPVDPRTGQEWKCDKSMSLYYAHGNQPEGTHPFGDPARDFSTVYGTDVNGWHTGHCPQLQLRFLRKAPRHNLHTVYLAAFQLVVEILGLAKSRSRVRKEVVSCGVTVTVEYHEGSLCRVPDWSSPLSAVG